MSFCNVKDNTINSLKSKGYIDEFMFVKSPLFFSENNRLSDLARDKYAVEDDGKLFTTSRVQTSESDREKAVPNEEFFTKLQDRHDIVTNEKSVDEEKNEFYQLIKDDTSPIINELAVTDANIEIANESPYSADEKIKRFLEEIGVAIQSVDVIKDRFGNKLNAAAKTDMLNKIIQVVEDKTSIDTLPEEAAHFFVEMLGEGSPLYKEMYSKITGYKIYQETVDEYKSKPTYRNTDGSINFDKIKKEAIGKVIAEHIIKFAPGSESPARIEATMTWWNKVWNFIKSIFYKSEDNPFSDAATQILDADTSNLTDVTTQDGEYYQLVDPLQGLMEDQDKIKLDNSIDPRTGQKRHIYTYEGEQAKGSVTSIYVDAWLKKTFKTDTRSFRQKEIDLLKAEFGDIIHEQMQDIIKSRTNDDGTRASVQKPLTKKVTDTIYDKLDGYIEDLMNQYEDGTIYKSEVKIYDKKTKVAGSVDLLVLKPNNHVDLFDWKSQEIAKDQTDIKQYKEPMYRIQLENYRKILQLQYGFQTFDRVRAIPIATVFNIGPNNTYQSLRDVEIGDIDPSAIPDNKNYLLPVTLRTESTGNSQLDELIKKLNGIYDKISNTKYAKEELYKKREELGRLREALRDLVLKNKVDRLIDLGTMEFKKYTEKMNSNTLLGKDIAEALKVLEVFGESGIMLYEIRQEMFEAAKESKNSDEIAEFEAINKKFLVMTSKINKLITDIQEYQKEQAKELGEKNGIFDLLNPEKAVGVLKGYFSSLSNIGQKSFRVFSKLLRVVQNRRDAKFDTMATKMVEIKKNVSKWASSRGMSTEKALEMILDIDEKNNWSGNFLRKFKPEFRKLRQEAVNRNDEKWLLDNLTYDEEAYLVAEKKQLEFFNSIQYSLDDRRNNQIIEDKMRGWQMSNKVLGANNKINNRALTNMNNPFLKPTENWVSDKWTELHRKDTNGNYINKELMEAFTYFQELNKQAEDLGMIDGYTSNFIPSMYANKLDQLVFGDVKNLFNIGNAFDNLQVDSGSTYTPEIDPTDGTIINRIPVYFTKDMGVQKEDGTVDYSKKSRDLFKIFGVWGAHIYNYEAMASIENDASILTEVEKNKQRLVTDMFGNVVMENGKVKAVDENDRNSKLLEDFVNYYIYGRMNGVFSDSKFKVFGKEYSSLKTFSSAVRFFSFKTLALNPISGTANFVGGTGNALFMAQKGTIFTKSLWAKAIVTATGGDKKGYAALSYLNILLEGNQRHMIDNLSLSATNKVLKSDNFFVIQRTSDKAVQYPIAIALMMNHMVDEATGKIVDINTYVKAKNNYQNFYNLPESERKALQKKIETEVTELMNTKSIYSAGVLDAKGNFSIPGIDKDSEAMSDFRSKIKAVSKKVVGNSSRDDINGIRTTMLGTALMQFRNWMPEMVEERFGGLQFDDELNMWTYGKTNLFFKEMFSKRFPILVKSIITGFGDSAIQGAKDKYQMMKRDAFEKGESFDISETEFIDMYIGNLRSQMLELMVFLGFGAAVMSVSRAGDDEKAKGLKKYLAKAMSKYYNEFAFYYNPLEFTRLVNKPLPVVGLAEDVYRLASATVREVYGQATGDKELIKRAKPLKAASKMIPVAKEMVSLWATFDDDFRKDWDIKLGPGLNGFQ